VAFLAVERRVAARGGSPLINVAVLARPPVRWAVVALTVATGTYYALLFTLAQYLQDGLGRSALVSGLTLVSWVAAFGLAGQLVRRMPARWVAVAPVAGCLLLVSAYAAISAALFTGHRGEPLLVVLLGLGGLGLGIQFSALISHLTTVVPADYAPDISGVSTTTMQIGGAVGVAAFGTLYLGASEHSGAGAAGHAFALTCAALAVVALLAAVAARAVSSTAPASRPAVPEPAAPVSR
jgi:MFS family permease